MLTDDGMLGTSPLLLAVAMRFGTAHDVGLRPDQLSGGFGSDVAVSWATVAGKREPNIRGATVLLEGQTLQLHLQQHGPNWCRDPLHQSCEQQIWLLGQVDTSATIRHWVKSPRLKVCSGVPAPGKLVFFLLGLGDRRPYKVFALSQRGLGTR